MIRAAIFARGPKHALQIVFCFPMVLSGPCGCANAPPAAVRAKFQGEFLDSSVDFDGDQLALPCSRPHGLIVSDDITGRLAVSAAPQLASGVVPDHS